MINPILWILAQESLPQLNGSLWSSLKGMTGGRKEGGTPSDQFHLEEQRGCCGLGLALGIFARRIYFSSSIWKSHILREEGSVTTHYTEQWVSYLLMETAQDQVKGLPGDGGRAQQEPHIIPEGTETGGVPATLQGNPHLKIVLSVQPSAPSKSHHAGQEQVSGHGRDLLWHMTGAASCFGSLIISPFSPKQLLSAPACVAGFHVFSEIQGLFLCPPKYFHPTQRLHV